MAKSEDIEAKLAAYVDDELDAADRAEIEKHLKDNPQHRQLIAELIEHRQMLKNLPRESAPGDVAEAINSQLERAVLLGDIDDDSHISNLRIGRGPQIRAIAAILFLTVGLAAAIYYMLPSPNRKPPQLADIRNMPTTAPTELPLAANESLDKSIEAQVPASQPVDALANAAPQTEQERRTNLALGGGTNDRSLASNVGNADQQMFRNVVADAKRENPAIGSSPVVIVIPSPDPQATHREVTDYLTSNKISWETSAEPMPSPIQYGPSQEISASRMQQVNVKLKQQNDAPTSVEMGKAASTQQQLITEKPLEDEPTVHGQTGQFIVARQLPRQQALVLGNAMENLRSRSADASSLILRDAEATTQPS